MSGVIPVNPPIVPPHAGSHDDVFNQAELQLQLAQLQFNNQQVTSAFLQSMSSAFLQSMSDTLKTS
jgi:hypothetical protein